MPTRPERRAIVREYKESYRPMGVYRLTNRVNGKMFVAASPNLPAIFNRLRMELRANGHLKHPQLQADWNEHGEEAFDFEVLEELAAPEAPGVDVSGDLAALESLWLEELEPWGERGYNRAPR
ncbi:MAG: GIY-YIG nuclease family protein [Thermoanaerobaculia bacterium]|nr:GIY-YIG nuclease family protein [Thermoanaerobaculia bacterium]